MMSPFGRTAGGILAGISECVQYVGGVATVTRQFEFDIMDMFLGEDEEPLGEQVGLSTEEQEPVDEEELFAEADEGPFVEEDEPLDEEGTVPFQGDGPPALLQDSPRFAVAFSAPSVTEDVQPSLEPLSSSSTGLTLQTTPAGSEVLLNTVAITSGPVTDGDSSIIPKITMAKKKGLLLMVAQKKATDPVGYKENVREAVVLKESCKSAAEQFGMAPANVEAYVRTQALIDLRKGVDISEPEVIFTAASQVGQEGEMEMAAIQAGLEAPLKEAKTSEVSSATVVTL